MMKIMAPKLTPEEREFISRLDNKLHYLLKDRYCGRPTTYDRYTEEKITVPELERLLEIVVEKDLFFMPMNTAMGFSVGFAVGELKAQAPGLQYELEGLLAFREKQLPPEYTFAKLSETFMRPRNLEIAGMVGEKIVNNRTRYDY